MAMNRVQFQSGLALSEFLDRYSSEASCESLVIASKWPEGFRCRRCQSALHSEFRRGGQRLFQCGSCHRQESVTAQTVFAETKLPLRIWFVALYFLVTTKNNVSALELKRHLGVCYRTAWRVKHKLMEAMTESEACRRLSGRVEMDDAYLGGELRGGKRGRGSENKQAFIAAVSTTDDGRPRFAVMRPVHSFTLAAVADFSACHLDPECDVYSDGLPAFTAVVNADHAHSTIISKNARTAAKQPAMKWINTVLGNVKRSLDGTYHSINVFKYAHRYLGEALWRFNRRFDLDAMLGQLVRSAVDCPPWPECRLRAVSAVC